VHWFRSFALLLASASAFTGCGIDPDVRLDVVDVQLMAEDTSWRASYLLQQPSDGAMQVATGREVHVPIGADVTLRLASRAYIADFALPQFGLRDFAAPDLPSELHFRADRAGRYDVRGDELCGRPHTDKTRGWLVVEDAAAYRVWIHERAKDMNQ
jgi:cytochrome c oxidase subunit 2